MAQPDIDLFDPDVQRDWFATYDVLRDQSPVFVTEGPDEMYVVTRYEDVMYALRHPEIFANGRGASSLLRSSEARRYWDRHGWKKQTPLGSNPPVHRVYRDMIDSFFDARAAAAATPMVEQIANELLDAWAPATTIDIVEAFALPLPVEVITRLLGFPVADIAQLRVWSAAWVMPFHMRLSEINIVDHLYIGGNETTTFALTSGARTLFSDHQLADRLRSDPARLATFVEENLRTESPTQGLFRVTTRQVTLADTTIPAGATVHLRYGAANRDPAMFACPGQVDLDRDNSRRHLAFAAGEHHCPGADLSRMEQHVAFAALLERCRDVSLDDNNDFAHRPSFVLWELDALHVRTATV